MIGLVDPRPSVLLVDGSYLDYSLERKAVADAGGQLIESGRRPSTEREVLNLPRLADATVLLVELAPITKAVLSAAKKCIAVIRYGTGLDNVDLDAARASGVAIESVSGYAAASVSEHTLSLMLATARRLLPHVARVSHGEWRPTEIELRPVGLEGRVLGIVGMGAIGRAIASRASAFGMRIIATDPYVSQSSIHDSIKMVPLGELLKESDYVSLHLPLNSETQGMIDKHWLSRCKPGMVLINTARGGLVNEEDLLNALDSGVIDCAALDVSVDEPLPADHPFRNDPRIIFTPHIAFWSDQAEQELRSSVARFAVRHLTESARI